MNYLFIKRLFIAFTLVLLLIGTVGVFMTEAKGGGGRSSGSSVSTGGSKSSFSSTPRSSTTHSSSSSSRPKASPAKPSFQSPSMQIPNTRINGRDVFLGAAGTYVIYQAVNDSDDCDYEDIMEGDADCKEVALTSDQIEQAGLEHPNHYQEQIDKENRFVFFVVFTIVTACIVFFVILYLIVRHYEKKRRRKRGFYR